MKKSLEQSLPVQKDLSHIEPAMQRSEVRDAVEWRARERYDQYATLFEKLFPGADETIEKITAEEATKIDVLVRQEIKAGKADSIEDALEQIITSGKLTPTRERISLEEAFRRPILQFFHAIENQNILKAQGIVYDYRDRLPQNSQVTFNETLHTLAIPRLESYIFQKNAKNVIAILEACRNVGIVITSQDLASCDPELLNNSTLKEAVQRNITTRIHHFAVFTDAILQFEELGIVTRQEILAHPDFLPFVCSVAEYKFNFGCWSDIQALKKWFQEMEKTQLATQKDIVAHSRLPEKAHDRLLSVFNFGYSSDLASFDTALQDFAGMGLVDVNAMVQDPDIKKRAVSRCSAVFGHGYPSQLSAFRDVQKGFVSRGIIEADEIIRLPRIKEITINHAVAIFGMGYPSQLDSFRNYRDEVVGMGIVKKEDLNFYPAIREGAKRHIATVLGSGYPSQISSYRHYRDTIISLGIFTKDEIEAMPAVKKYKEKIMS